MSELKINAVANRNLRFKLLVGASAMALVTGACSDVMAEDSTVRPTVWIELGAQLERQLGQGDPYSPDFVVNNPESPAFSSESPLHLDKSPLFSNGIEGSISFQPEGEDWIFSASIRYGRSNGRKNVNRDQKIDHPAHFTGGLSYQYVDGQFVWNPPSMGTLTQTADIFAQTQVIQRQTHAVIDFSAGRDVGLGLFGRNGSSVLSVGVRFAQFTSRSSVTIHARPDAEFFFYCNTYNAQYFHSVFPSHPKFCFPEKGFHTFAGSFESRRNFHGVGPSIAWNGSTPVLGNPDREVFAIDWGVNAAVLFGRQRASGHHQTSGHNSVGNYLSYATPAPYNRSRSFNRSRSVIVPNVGGMLGASLELPNARVSFGYRGDFFFGAMDTGIDAGKTKIVGFYGPFATISIGLGG